METLNYKLAVDLGEAFLGSSSHFLTDEKGIAKLVSLGVKNAFMVAGIVLIIIIAYAGISMITAAGSAQQFERARTIMTVGITGFVIVIASWLIVKAIEYSTGVDILGIVGPVG